MDKRLRYLLSLLILILASTPQVYAQAPVANFNISSTTGCMPSATFTFTNTSTNSPTSYTWNFGTTGQPNSNLQNPVINTNVVGTHTITLTATNSFGSNAISKTITVYPQPIISFTTLDTFQTCPPKLVNFTNTTVLGTAGAGTYAWNFGDGNTSTATNPSNNYLTGGNYNVTLTATNSGGCSNSATFTNFVKVPLFPSPNFTSANNIACSLPATVNFTNTSTNTNASTVYTWNFGNGSQTVTGPTSVSNSYSTSGFYSVTLTASNGLCSTSTTKSNYVEADVLSPNFTYSPTTICRKTPVTFTNTTLPNTTGTSTWYFGDGDSAVSTNAVHAYQSSGTFTVTLKVDYKGCIKTSTQTVVVSPSPTNAVTITPTACTTPLTYIFNGGVTGGTTYSWSFGDGNSSSLQSTTHTYAAAGNYTVIFTSTNTATGCSTIDTINFYAGKPIVSIRDSGNHCDSMQISFWATKNPFVATSAYTWDFGDGSPLTSTGFPDSFRLHSYTAPGTYQVKVTYNWMGCTETSLVKTVIISPDPQPSFTALDSVCPKAGVLFTNLTPRINFEMPLIWWFYGEPNDPHGYVDTGATHMHYYNGHGRYEVIMYAGYKGCLKTFRDSVYIGYPKADYRFYNSCSQRNVVTFKDTSLSSGNNTTVLNYIWNFGTPSIPVINTWSTPPLYGGVPFNVTYPTIVGNTNTYTVSLMVIDTVSKCTSTHIQPVHLIDYKPILTVNDSDICFTNSAADSFRFYIPNSPFIYDTKWVFGTAVGDTSTGQFWNGATQRSVRRRYYAPGIYSFTLRLQDVNKCWSSFVYDSLLRVNDPVVNFKTLPPLGCVPLTVNFSDSITGSYGANYYTWNFGDGSPTDTSKNPSHTYNAIGTYTVKLNVTNYAGCKDSLTKTNAISVYNITPSFTTIDTLVCLGVNATFTNTTPNGTIYHWDFGDGATSNAQHGVHAYSSAGTYTVKLVVSDINGCKDSVSKQIVAANMNLNFTMSDSFKLCPPLFDTLVNTSTNVGSIVWDFGNGNGSTLDSAVVVYPNAGTFVVKLTGYNGAGCVDSLTKTITIPGLLTDTMYFTPTSGCQPLTVNFTCVSQAPHFQWFMGNSFADTSSIGSYTYTYTQHGKYVPSVVVSDPIDASCQRAIFSTDTLIVEEVIADFNFATSDSCDLSVQFYDTVLQAFYPTDSIIWDFGDATSSYLHNPLHTYAIPGTYTVTLKIKTTKGCMDMVTKTVTVMPAPNMTASAAVPFICAGQSTTLTASGATAYLWSPTDSLSCPTCASTLASPDTTTTYMVVGTQHGCVDTATVTLPVYMPKADTIYPVICQGQQYFFNGTNYTTSVNNVIGVFTTFQGCDSVVTMNLTVNPAPTTIDYDTICPNQLPYTWNGIANAKTNDSLLFTGAAGGCDSVSKLHLTVLPYNTGTRNVSICQGLGYPFGDSVYYISKPSSLGITDTFASTTGGCDSIVTLNLTVAPYLTGSLNVGICQGQSYSFNGQIYTSSTVASDTLKNSAGCDSIVTLNLTVAPYLTGTFNHTICQGQSYLFNGTNYTTSTSGVMDTTQTLGGCDSIVTLNLTVAPYLTGSLNVGICQGQSYSFNGLTYTSSTVASDTLKNSAGCDSIVTLNLTVAPYLTGTFNHTICQGQSYLFNGTNYTASISGVMDTTQTAGGCDSIVTLNLTVAPYLTGALNVGICQGQSYSFNGLTYTSSAVASDTLKNSAGCDSIVTLNLTVAPYLTGTFNHTICQGQSYLFNGTNYTASISGVMDTTQTAGGCDSIVTLNLTVAPYLTGALNVGICQGQSYSFNGLTYTSSTVASDTLKNSAGCDSIVTLNLTVAPYLTGTFNHTICQGQSYLFNGTNYTTSITGVMDTTQTVGGCDSIITLNLVVNPPLTGTDNITICANQLPYAWYTKLNAQNGDTIQIKNANGCDSIATLALTILPYVQSTRTVTICQGGSYVFNNVTYTTAVAVSAGIKDTFITTTTGCDSIITLELLVNPPLTGTDIINICANQLPFTWYTKPNAQNGDTLQVKNANGCDSIATLQLSVTPFIQKTQNATICQGTSYIFNGNTYTTSVPISAAITDTAISVGAGCDTIITLNLVVNPPLTGMDNITICANQLPYAWYTKLNAQNGDTIQIKNANGCDSIATLALTILPYVQATRTVTICQGGSYVFNNVTYTTAVAVSAGIKDTVLTTTTGCDSIITLELLVNPPLTGTDIINICANQLPFTWYTKVNAQNGDTLQVKNVNGCDSIATLQLSVTPFIQKTQNATICQGTGYFFNGNTYTTSVPISAAITDTAIAVGAGCDTIITLNLVVNPPLTGTDNITICANQLPYAWYTKLNAQNGDTIQIKNANGCDSIATLALTILPYVQSTRTVTICQGGSYVFNNVTYTTAVAVSAGIKDTVITTTTGCDSIITLELLVNPPLTGTDIINICANQLPFTWYTKVNAQNGDTLQVKNANGCDSIATLQLSITPFVQVTRNATICQGVGYLFNGTTYYTSVPPSANITDTTIAVGAGCDTIITLNLVVNPPLTGTDIINICANQLPFTWYTKVNAQNGDTIHVKNANGCDSIATLQLSITPFVQVTRNATICQGVGYLFNGTTYYTSVPSSANITDTTIAVGAGCDTIITLNLVVNPPLTGTDIITICANQLPFTWYTKVNAQNGDTIHVKNANGCDSIATLQLSITPFVQVTRNATICQGVGYLFNGTTYYTSVPSSSNITDTTIAVGAGCDTIITLNLVVNPPLTGTDIINICANQLPFTWYTKANAQNGDTIHVKNANGCDSIATLALTITPYVQATRSITICQSMSYTFNGVTYYTSVPASAGIKDTIVTTTTGCDSIITLDLTVVNFVAATRTVAICQGQSYTFNGITYTTSNFTALDTIVATVGCDTLLTLNLTVHPLPNVTTNISTAICFGQSLVLNATGATTYSWSPATGLSTTTGASVTASPTTTTSYIVTGTDVNGCVDTGMTTITVNPLPVVLAAVDQDTICPGIVVTLSATGAASYAWTPSLPCAAPCQTLTATPLISTTYIVAGLDSVGCTDTDTIKVFVHPGLNMQVSNDTAICYGFSTPLQVSGGVSHTWYPSTGLSCTSCTNPIASPLTTTTYSVAGIDANGCLDTLQVTVTVNPSPVISGNDDVLSCAGDTIQIQLTGAQNYSWTPSTGLSCNNCSNPVAILTNTTTFTIIASDGVGCADTATMTITVNPLPIVVASNDATICIGDSVLLNVTGADTVLWSPTVGLSCIDCFQPMASPITSTLYTVLGIDTNGCKNTDDVLVTVIPLPTVSAGADQVLCAGSSVLLTATGASTYLWSPPNYLSCVQCDTPTASPPDTMTYTVFGTDAFGCFNVDSVTIFSIEHQPVSFSMGDTICLGESTQLYASGGDVYQWMPPTYLDNANINNPIATPNQTTRFTVFIKQGFCFVDTGYVDIYLPPTPTVDAGPDKTIFAGDQVTLDITATNATTYSWTPTATLSCSDCPEPIATPLVRKTTYVIVVSDDYGCKASDSVTITMTCDNSLLFMANVFTPNGDGNNDRFFPQGKGISVIYSFKVYSRWGELMYEAYNIPINDENYGWDGTFKGIPLDPDVYVYSIDGICILGDRFFKKGDVSLIR